MPIATHHSKRRDTSSASSTASPAQKKEGGRVAVIAVAAAGRSITTRFVLGRELGSGRITCVRLTGRGCHAGQLTFPALLDCLPHEDGTCSFERPTTPLSHHLRSRPAG